MQLGSLYCSISFCIVSGMYNKRASLTWTASYCTVFDSPLSFSYALVKFIASILYQSTCQGLPSCVSQGLFVLLSLNSGCLQLFQSLSSSEHSRVTVRAALVLLNCFTCHVIQISICGVQHVHNTKHMTATKFVVDVLEAGTTSGE